MLENTLANGERPEELIVYGGSGRVARNWDCYHAIVAALVTLEDDQTLFIQSGKPVAVFRTHPLAPRVLTANTNLVGKWANWETFRELEAKGLMMYGQYTAGTWCYIGTQGILQGTYETFAACASERFGGDLGGRVVLTAGLGGMGGAQPLAVKMAGGVCIAVEVDRAKAERRLESGYCDVILHDVDEALAAARAAAARREAIGVALIGNAAEVFPRLLEQGFEPDVVTDQTSAHDPLNGYVPVDYSLSHAIDVRARDPERYIADSTASMVRQVRAMLGFQARGAVVFEYGNNIRGAARDAGEPRAFDIQGFVPLFVRPSFCVGRGPFRWVCLSGEADDLRLTDQAVLREFPDDARLRTWMDMAMARVPIENLLARPRRARPFRPPAQRDGSLGRAPGAGGVVARPSRQRFGGAADARDRGHGGRLRRDRRLAAAERHGQHRQRRRFGIDPPGRGKRHGRLDFGRPDRHRRRQRCGR